jgi:uncharacterized protein YndB with AHSA1/START domain
VSKTRIVSRTRIIKATPSKIFDLLADPSQHARFDGSGTVVGAQGGTRERLAKGATFGMKMRVGAPYKITNTVVEFEPDSVVSWRHFGGHVWKYQLQPVDGGAATQVTESFDWSTSKSPLLLELARYPSRNTKSIEKTLARLAELVEKP